MSKNKIILILVAVGLVGGFLLFSSAPSYKTDELKVKVEEPARIVATQPVLPQKESSPAATDKTVKEFSLESTPFTFSVKEIRVKLGDKVKINLTNKAGFHNLVVDEFNASTKQLSTGATDSVQFTADKKGTFEYYCSVGNHRQQGMVGKLIVE